MEEESLQVLGETESSHFWPQTKIRIVHALISRYIGQMQQSMRLLDIGCGNGILMQFLSAKYPHIQCTGIDGHPVALQLARQRVPDARLVLQDFMRINEWDPKNQYDVITLLDVIEHLDDPVQFLQLLKNRLVANGILIVSVPAFMQLWSERDEFLGHRKRYTKRSLQNEMHAAGWRVQHCNYAYSFMFLPVYVMRKIMYPFIRYSGQKMEASELRAIPLVNGVLRTIGAIEAKLQTKIPMPWGTSVVCIAH